MQPVVLDTDVASRLHRGTLTGPLATRLIGREPLISFVTFGELAKWAEIRHWGQRRRRELAAWLAGMAVLPGMRPSPPRGVSSPRRRPCAGGRALNDMWVAACCLAHEVPLATLNIKDYSDFTLHHGLRILGA